MRRVWQMGIFLQCHDGPQSRDSLSPTFYYSSIYGKGKNLQSSIISAHIFLTYTVRRSQWTAPYRVLIRIDFCFMLSHRMEHSTAGHPTAWQGIPWCYLASLCWPVFVYVRKRKEACEWTWYINTVSWQMKHFHKGTKAGLHKHI